MSDPTSPHGLTFWCHNVGRSAVSLTSLLAGWGDDGPDVVLLQELPWVRIGTARSLFFFFYNLFVLRVIHKLQGNCAPL